MDRFLISVWASLIFSSFVLVVLILFFDPGNFALTTFVLFLGYIINTITALFLFYINRKKLKMGDSSRNLFRKSYGIGFVVGLAAILILIIQIIFDII